MFNQSLTVLVTRTPPAGAELCQLLQAAGLKTIYFPTIEIQPCIQDDFIQALEEFPSLDWLIFISPQAVLVGLPVIQKRWPVLPAQLQTAALGGGTAAALEKQGITVDIFPSQEWHSEGLLALPEMQAVAGKKIAIVQGEGGREFLAEELTARGAIIKHLIAYKRSIPSVNTDIFINKIDVIICTSGEAVQNLKQLAGSAHWPLLQNTTLLVVSQRIHAIAKKCGFRKIQIIKNASYDAIIEGILMSQKNINWQTISIISSLVIMAIVIAVFGFFFFKEQHLQHSALQTLTKLENQVTQLKQDMGVLPGRTETQIQQLQNELNLQKQTLAALSAAQQIKQDNWAISEARYLVELASNNLQLADNIPLAIKLLQAADAELSRLNDANVLPIRKAIAQDIAALQAVPLVDVSGLYLHLATLNEQFENLPLAMRPQNPPLDMNANPKKLSWWQQGLAQSWQTLRQIIVVRYVEDNKLPLIMPDQKIFLLQNCHAALAQAMWGVLNKQPAVYQKSLQQAIDWLTQYFDLNAKSVQMMLSELKQLQQLNLHPSVPRLSSLPVYDKS